MNIKTPPKKDAVKVAGKRGHSSYDSLGGCFHDHYLYNALAPLQRHPNTPARKAREIAKEAAALARNKTKPSPCLPFVRRSVKTVCYAFGVPSGYLFYKFPKKIFDKTAFFTTGKQITQIKKGAILIRSKSRSYLQTFAKWEESKSKKIEERAHYIWNRIKNPYLHLKAKLLSLFKKAHFSLKMPKWKWKWKMPRFKKGRFDWIKQIDNKLEQFLQSCAERLNKSVQNFIKYFRKLKPKWSYKPKWKWTIPFWPALKKEWKLFWKELFEKIEAFHSNFQEKVSDNVEKIPKWKQIQDKAWDKCLQWGKRTYAFLLPYVLAPFKGIMFLLELIIAPFFSLLLKPFKIFYRKGRKLVPKVRNFTQRLLNVRFNNRFQLPRIPRIALKPYLVQIQKKFHQISFPVTQGIALFFREIAQAFSDSVREICEMFEQK